MDRKHGVTKLYQLSQSYVRPARLPRGFPCLVTATFYHPPSSDDSEILEYLSTSLTWVESHFPGCGIILAGDFNRLDIKNICINFGLKQIVTIPTRGENTLDLVLTNLHPFYQTDSITAYPPFGLSDHSVIAISPRVRDPKSNQKKIVYKRDMRPSRKSMFGRYLNEIDWSFLDSPNSIDAKGCYFTDVLSIGLSYILPEKRFMVHPNDHPWINEDVRRLIKPRQRALFAGNTTLFKLYRNRINRKRKNRKADYYKSKVENLKHSNPKQWWREVKHISGMISSPSLQNCIKIENLDNLPISDLANAINNAFLEPMKELDLFFPIDPQENSISEHSRDITTPWETYKKLKSLNVSKAPGPDAIPNFLYKEFAEILACPISNLINCSSRHQSLPSLWKLANVIPVPKEKVELDINTYLRPISLTCCLAKMAEEFVIEKFVGPAILKYIDPNQLGKIPRSSSTIALISMLHNWAGATDDSGNSVRVLLVDYRKAFDLIDHSILINKIRLLPIPNFVINWLISFLCGRKQRVKLARDCVSEWGAVPCGVPQGTKLGPWLSILMINDLKLTDITHWKYIDDTTVSEIIPRNGISQIQSGANELERWNTQNKFQLNVQKCKELLFQFHRNRIPFDKINLSTGCPNLVRQAKILGV